MGLNMHLRATYSSRSASSSSNQVNPISASESTSSTPPITVNTELKVSAVATRLRKDQKPAPAPAPAPADPPIPTSLPTPPPTITLPTSPAPPSSQTPSLAHHSPITQPGSVNNGTPPASRTSTLRRPSKRQRRTSTQANGEDFGNSTVQERPSTRYSDVGGLEGCMQEVRELVEYPLTHPELYVHLGVQPPRGVLLHGPPGCGKTLLATAIAGELGVPFLRIAAPEVVSGMSGESEAKIRELFASAKSQAPCLVFIDEIDAITPKRDTAQREMERRIVAQLLTCMDDLSMENTSGKAVIVIGATNRPDALDAALRRAGRFDREIALGIPDLAARERILRVLTAKMRLSGDFDYPLLARKTPGFVGADLTALTKEAAVMAVHRIFQSLPTPSLDDATMPSPALPLLPSSSSRFDPLPNLSDDVSPIENEEPSTLENKDEPSRSLVSDRLRAQVTPLTAEQLEPLSITMIDFERAVTKVQPSAKREGFATIPDVSWEDVGALDDIRNELVLTICEPIRFPERFAALGLTVPAGVLLYGPPGCGKTLLAKAVANESGANFISVAGPELLNKYVGESERAVRQVFQRGRASAPCIVFFDELDALCPRRGGGDGNGSTERVVNQLLTEMDGVDARTNVFVIAATNRPDMIDAAMLRPGRLEKLLYVSLPTAEGRLAILRTATRRTPLAPDVSLEVIAQDPRTQGFSGADLSALIREACVATLRSTSSNNMTPSELRVSAEHFTIALDKVSPSVSKYDQAQYAAMRDFRTRQHRLPP
eukprot:CAMPEP_0184662832 /NCGR_PEP_ID=MMETSP0308-20130426/45141_1 /TAXON_ID=38269 /ORGANISM="Gloeochaete witrockiana, Strain SAG 46.84" /LENGTH=771 /DNA_ID=CAMNT_0027105117 /DNA_START=76 /DNA_END=2391 /DNA_ORIENTATION=+